ncbi:MAG: hypothetical protein RJA22_109 [Verrucomicrobiota bacterium]|jgi:hypothetical protein
MRNPFPLLHALRRWTFAALLGVGGLLAPGARGAEAAAGDPAAHWAFQPLSRPPVPRVPAGFSTNPIDAFVLARRAAAGLKPSPPAEARTLLRRAQFSLVGLPPTPEEMEAFLADRAPDAYERVVDRLLASPRHGERWARHWLDVVRYAETHGFEMNNPRPNAWPYRDYVIRAFNEDKPYDQFILEQLAGDALGTDEATGFLVAGAWDQVKSPDVVLTRNQRADELHDMVGVTGTAFLGLTLGCARCHDHKFDPVPQDDYYAVKAVFEGVQHAERPRRDPEAAAREERQRAAGRRLAEVEQALAEFEPPAQAGPGIDTNRLRAPVHPRLNTERFDPVTARRLRFTVEATTDAEPCLDELEAYGPGSTNNLALATRGVKTAASSVYPNSTIHRLEHINDGQLGNSRSWISNERGRGWVELQFPAPVTLHRLVWGRDREQRFQDRLPTRYRIEVDDGAGAWRTVASSADRQPYARGAAPVAMITHHLAPGQARQAAALAAERQRLADSLRQLKARPMVYAGEFKAPPPTHRFHRGDPMHPGPVVAPGTLTFAAFRAGAPSTLATNTPEQERRLALARWIASPANPLTARVLVNRLWQHHVGEGLVATPSDFGRHGARPTHPELLDWLAGELIRGGWRMKPIHRLIVTSATYRQAADARTSGRDVADPDNRLLWRMNAHRLDAECIRDSILAVGGRLDLRMGGPGWSPFVPNDNYVRVYTPKDTFGSNDFRRMIYATVVRQRPDGVFGAFDCPDAGQPAARRTRSTTPLQALNLWNSGFMGQAAGFLAERLEREAGAGAEAQARRGFALAFQRAPDAAELAAAAALIRAEGLPAFCRALFNANEFVYVF